MDQKLLMLPHPVHWEFLTGGRPLIESETHQA